MDVITNTMILEQRGYYPMKLNPPIPTGMWV